MRLALVTGGSGAIGSVICRQLAADGCHVLVHAHHGRDAAQQLVKEILSTGGSAEPLFFDVTHAQEVSDSLAPILARNPVQILVNNAGIADDAVMAGMHPSQWQRVVDTTLTGFFNVTQPLLLPMLATRWGRIINISSVAGILGNRGQTNYAAAKAGLIGATKSLALEVASRGITVNAVAPGIISSAMTEQIFTPTLLAQLVPMKRAGHPQEVADLVSFLASEKTAYITGQVLSVDGGMT